MANAKKEYRVAAPRKEVDSKGEEKTYWSNVGVGFENDKGISLRLNALPLNFTGELVLFDRADDKEPPRSGARR